MISLKMMWRKLQIGVRVKLRMGSGFQEQQNDIKDKFRVKSKAKIKYELIKSHFTDEQTLILFYNSFKLYISKNDAYFLYTFPPSSMNLPKIPKHMNYLQNQVFGNDQPFQNIEHEDIINALQFDPSGELLAIGDNAGRIILFKEQEDQFGDKKSFEYYSEFQSHQTEFDTLKSTTTCPSISHIKWLRPQGKYQKMITSNSNCIKLWKMFEKIETRVASIDDDLADHSQHFDLSIPLLNKQTSFSSKCQVLFPVKHQSTINQAQVAKNEEYLFSSDEDRAIMWNFEKFKDPFVVEQIKDKKNWKEGQKISCSKLHPNTDNIFTIGTTKGRIQFNDLRTSLNNRKNTQFYFEKQTQKSQDYFNQITTKINSLQFMSSGKHIISRDYLTVKIWDLCRTSQPLSVIQINPGMRDKMCHLFQNQCLEDQFQLTSLNQDLIVTGNYDNKFHIVDPLGCRNIEYSMDFQIKNTQKCFVDTQKRNLRQNFNQNKKVLACGVHRQSKKIALASLNSFFIYSQQKQCPVQMDLEA